MSEIKLIQGDCLDVMKRIDNESIDLIITDPPYKITSRGGSGTMGGFWKEDIAKKGKIFRNNNISCKDYLPEFYRILKDKSICYLMTNNTNLIEMLNVATDLRTAEEIKANKKPYGFNFVKCLIWEKGNKICGRYYMNCFEYILLFRKGGDKPINNCGTPDILKVPIKKLKDVDGKNLHDTEKPVELARILIKNSSNGGDIIMDSFMGIGFVGLACKNLNRNFIGIELDENYFNIAKERISKLNK